MGWLVVNKGLEKNKILGESARKLAYKFTCQLNVVELGSCPIILVEVRVSWP